MDEAEKSAEPKLVVKVMRYIHGTPERRLNGADDLRSKPLTRDDIALAAATLRRMRLRKRGRSAGVVHGKRIRLGTQVVLSDGSRAEILDAVRGNILVQVDDPQAVTGYQRLLVKEHEISIVKSGAATALGALKKDCHEIKSPKKLVSCRQNALRPPRPGSRPRGRPRTVKAAPGNVQDRHLEERPPIGMSFDEAVAFYSRHSSNQPVRS